MPSPLAAALGGGEERPLYLPVGLDRVRLGAPPGPEIWARAVVRRRLGARAQAVVADVWAWNAAGETVAQLEGLRLERASREALLLDAGPLRREALFDVTWEETPPVAEAPPDASGTWILLGERAGVGARLAAGLSRTAARGIIVSEASAFARIGSDRYELNPRSVDDFRALFAALAAEDTAVQGAVLLWGLDDPPGPDVTTERLRRLEERLCGSALHLIQAAARSSDSPPPRVFLVTRGAQPVPPLQSGVVPSAAPLWGLARTAALEHPELRPFVIDLDPVPWAGEDEALLAEILSAGEGSVASGWQVALRGGKRYEARLTRVRCDRPAKAARPEAAPVRLEIRTPGVIDDLVLRPAARRTPGPGEVEIRVLAAGVNFRDLLKALGVYPGEPGPLGDECAGIVSAIGPGVTSCKPGDEVVALATGAFATFAVASEELVAAKPEALTFAEAASVPGAFLTAEYALRHVAALAPGERVLIHAAAGGVGLAAVEIARRTGAEVFATAGSPEKQDYLRALGVRHVFGSRSLEFVAALQEATHGEGVDVVLNSLAREFIPSSLSALKPGGRFVELGRTGIWSEAQVAALGRGIRYYPVFFADTCREQPRLAQSMLVDLLARLTDGRLSLPPVRAFTLEAAPEAFRFMAQARHIGKLVLTIGEVTPPPLSA
jgi:NADPH:quinone reductase-like Zn-dependent oxidoreductase